MKKNLLLIPTLAIILIACNSEEAATKKLERLKQEVATLNDEISLLEKELAESNTDTTDHSISVLTYSLTPTIFKNYINIQGKVDAEENIAVSSHIPGTITKINVKVGDKVSSGQVLAETDDKAIRQQINALKANMELAQQVYERQQGLWDLKIGTEMQLLQAKTNKESVERQMAALTEQLRMSKIVSPISGTIDAVNIKLGEVASPGMPSIRVINFAKLKIMAEVAESYASKIEKGADVIIHFPDLNDSIVSKVNFVSGSINAVTRTFHVEVSLAANKKYHPNMVADLTINDYKSDKPVIVIPVKLIQKDENENPFVYISDNGIAKKITIVVGKQYKGHSEVLSGLKSGDMIVSEGYNTINEGDVLKVNN
jgi:membrane fusion protein, multidrug efflux system